MVKDIEKTLTAPEVNKNDPKKGDSQASVVSKIMKKKNRFRAGLGFKQNSQTNDDGKGKVNQTLSRRKILQGTKGEKGKVNDEDDGEDINRDGMEIEVGSRNVKYFEDVDEETSFSEIAARKKTKYSDPRTAFLEEINKESK